MNFFRYFNRKSFTLLIPIALMSVASCAIQNPKNAIFDLMVPNINKIQLAQKPVQLVVAQPNALKALDGQDILIKDEMGFLVALKNFQWSDRLPELIQARMIQSLANSAILKGVTKRGEGIDANYVLWIDIHDFEVQLLANKLRQAYVALTARLVDNRTGTVIASQNFYSQEIFKAGKSLDYLKALNVAFGRVAQTLVYWTLVKIPKNK